MKDFEGFVIDKLISIENRIAKVETKLLIASALVSLIVASIVEWVR